MAGLILTIAQQKGGSGKTTIAANLAIAALLDGQSVAVLDTDPQGSLGRWFMTRHEATDGEPGLTFATASAWGVGYEVGKLKDAHDLVIVDTPPKADSDLRPALREADLVVVPVNASQLDLWATESVLDLVERTRRPAITVLNRTRAGTRLAGDIAAQLGGLLVPMAASLLGNRVAYTEALGAGLGVGEMARGAAAAAEIEALRAELMAAIGN